MKYGAKGPRWGKIQSEPAGARPTYEAPQKIGSLMKVTESLSMNEAKGYGDNVLKVYVNEFKECGLATEVTELPAAQLADMVGATLAESGDLSFATEDAPSYGGYAFYINKAKDNGSKVFQGVFYPKTKAVIQGDEYSTKGDSITLASDKLQMMASACNSGEWKVMSQEFTTEAEADAWCDAQFTGASA